MIKRLPRGIRICIWSITAGAVCAIPLGLYILFGPADGNPIGLGLLFVAGGVIAQAGVLAGIAALMIDYFRARFG